MDKLNWLREYNKLFDFINRKDTKEYFSGTRFLKIIKEFDNSFLDYIQYIEYRKEKGLSTSRKKYFLDILNMFEEDIKLEIIKRIYEDAKSTMENKTNKSSEVENNNIQEIKLLSKTTNNPIIFMSYSWSNENIADSLELLFKTKNIYLQRDKRELIYRDSIKEFMKKIRKSDYCLMIISDEYLKSINCMYEILEFVKDDNYKERIRHLIHKDLDIFNITGKTQYVKYWELESKKIHKLLSEVEELNKTEIIEEAKKVDNIKRNIGEFLSFISDTNNIIFNNNITKDNFDTIYFSLFPNEKFENIYKYTEGYFILNVPRTIRVENILWWEKDDGEYTREINNAKIFTEEEMKSIIYGINGNRKFSAVPISQFIPKLGQNRIPWDYHFKKIFIKNKQYIIGNQDIYLDDKEIELLI